MGDGFGAIANGKLIIPSYQESSYLSVATGVPSFTGSGELPGDGALPFTRNVELPRERLFGCGGGVPPFTGNAEQPGEQLFGCGGGVPSSTGNPELPGGGVSPFTGNVERPREHLFGCGGGVPPPFTFHMGC